jgi:acetyl esterase/lipase
VPYGAETGRAHLLDILKPKNATRSIPAIVHFHGGAWKTFGKNLQDCVFLAEAGFCAVSANYRYSQEATFPAQIHDAKAAIRWLRAKANDLGIDPNHIGVWGISAGGHLAALLGTTSDNLAVEGNVGVTGFSSDVQAVTSICAPTDLLDPNWELVQDPIGEVWWDLLGGTAAEQLELARLASPALQATLRAAPFLIVHGAKDAHVPFSQAERLHYALQHLGVPNRFEVIADGDHFINVTHTHPLQHAMLEFFRKVLGNPLLGGYQARSAQ